MNEGMNLVAHVRRTEAGLTKMQVQIPIRMRAGMAALSKRLGISQLAIVRSALAAYLLANAEPTTETALEAAPETAPEAATEAKTESPAEAPVVSHEDQAVAPVARKPRAKKASS